MGVVSVDQMVYKWELQEAVDNGGEEAYGRRNGSRNGDVKKRSVSQKWNGPGKEIQMSETNNLTDPPSALKVKLMVRRPLDTLVEQVGLYLIKPQFLLTCTFRASCRSTRPPPPSTLKSPSWREPRWATCSGQRLPPGRRGPSLSTNTSLRTSGISWTHICISFHFTIIFVPRPDVDPSLIERQNQLKRARLADQLASQLSHRPGPLELIQKNILHTVSYCFSCSSCSSSYFY